MLRDRLSVVNAETETTDMNIYILQNIYHGM